MKSETKPIPYEKLKDGYLRCLNHIRRLVESGRLLFNAKQYYASIPISILAYEESYKITLFQHHISKKIGIDSQTWEKISKGDIAHRHKLVGSYIDEKAKLKNEIGKSKYEQIEKVRKELGFETIPYEKAIKQDGVGEERLAILNEVKKQSLYLNWNNSDWTTFFDSTNEVEQEALAYVELFTAHFMVVGAYRWLKWPIIPSPNTPEFKEFENDEIIKEDKRLHEHLKTDSFREKVMIANSVLDRYRLSVRNRR